MPDTKEAPRALTEGEAYAIAAAEVKRETAERDQKISELEAEKAQLTAAAEAELQKAKDLHEAALTAERQRADAAEQALTDYKAEVENARVAAARTEQRVSKVREVAKHLNDEWFTPERAARWASMDDDSFDVYVRELAEVSVGSGTATGEPPRETAMAGVAVTEKKTGNLKALFGGVN